MALGLRALAPPPPTRVPVLVAARDLPAGHRLQAADLRIAAWAPGSGPRGALSSRTGAVGRVSAGPLAEGSAISDAELVGPGLLTGQPADLLAMSVPVSAGPLAGLVGRGDRVDVISAATSDTVVTDAVVLANPAYPSEAGGGLGLGSTTSPEAGGSEAGLAGEPVILGVHLGEAERLAHAEAVGALTIAVHPR